MSAASANDVGRAELAISCWPATITPNLPRQPIAAELSTSTTLRRDEALIAWLADSGNARPESDDDAGDVLNYSRAEETTETAVNAWDMIFDSLEPATTEIV